MAYGKRLIAAGVAALVVGLAVTFPARVAYQWFAPDEINLSGITGSVWNGAATQGSAAGLFLSDLTWRFRPLALFGLKAGYTVAARLPSGFLESDVAIGAGNRVQLDNLAAVIPLTALGPLLPVPGIGGDMNLQFNRLVINDGFPTHADGTVSISDLLLRALSPNALGDFRVVLQTDDDVIRGMVEDVSGVLRVNGSAILNRDRTYSFVGQVAPTASTPAAIVDELRFLGSPDEQGWREFRFEG
ncbi:MAG TPA: type II secretion system protein N, partial [Woeseiaceae bacterium]